MLFYNHSPNLLYGSSENDYTMFYMGRIHDDVNYSTCHLHIVYS